MSECAYSIAIIKYICVAELVLLVIQTFARSLRKNASHAENVLNLAREQTYWQVVKSGFLPNALNPLSILYFMVLYRQLLEPGASMLVQFAEIGILCMAI